jgi:hypothetical protein
MQGGGHANDTGDMLAAYGGWRHDRFYVSALASYSSDDYGLSRSVNLASGSQSQDASPKAGPTTSAFCATHSARTPRADSNSTSKVAPAER